MVSNQEMTEAEIEAMEIIGGAMDHLTELMPPIEVARVMTMHSVIGLVHLGGYEELLKILPKAVAKVCDARLG